MKCASMFTEICRTVKRLLATKLIDDLGILVPTKKKLIPIQSGSEKNNDSAPWTTLCVAYPYGINS